MNVSDERLEILIGKLLDGELSLAERRLLDEELSHNDEARALLEQLRALDAGSRGAVAWRIAPRAGEPHVVFERAWQRHVKSPWQRIVRLRTKGGLRFVAGLAAGFLLGLVLHFVLVRSSTAPNEPPSEPVPSPWVRAIPETGAVPRIDSERVRPVIRNVDWYTFTDDAGNQWLVEGVREGMVRPAAYRGQLR